MGQIIKFFIWYIDCMDHCYLIDEAYIETKTDTLRHKAEF